MEHRLMRDVMAQGQGESAGMHLAEPYMVLAKLLLLP
jgi:hypothetical protein